jgi:hypothetical protein
LLIDSTFILGSLLIWTPSFLLLAGATSAGTGSVRAFLTPLEAFLAKQLGFYLYAVTAGLIMNVRVAIAVLLHWKDMLRSRADSVRGSDRAKATRSSTPPVPHTFGSSQRH